MERRKGMDVDLSSLFCFVFLRTIDNQYDQIDIETFA